MSPGLLLSLVLPLAACAADRAPDRDGSDALKGKLEKHFTVPGYEDRDYLLHLPPGYDGTAAIPVVFALHGGGGNGDGMKRLSCQDGRRLSGTCLTDLADDEGFAVVFPNGIGNQLIPDHRSWNAGGGADGWRCTGGRACDENVDDVAYFDTLLEELNRSLNVDPRRIYATGISNGGAMSHRLACERSEVFAAIATVGGENQLQTVQGCAPTRPVPVLQIHGEDDPCWPYAGGPFACLQDNGDGTGDGKGDFVSATASAAGWVQRDRCVAASTEETLPNPEDDGTSETLLTWSRCRDGAEVSLLTVHGGGHTWPGGWSYLNERVIGVTSQDFSANETIWAFLYKHPLPEDP